MLRGSTVRLCCQLVMPFSDLDTTTWLRLAWRQAPVWVQYCIPHPRTLLAIAGADSPASPRSTERACVSPAANSAKQGVAESSSGFTSAAGAGSSVSPGAVGVYSTDSDSPESDDDVRLPPGDEVQRREFKLWGRESRGRYFLAGASRTSPGVEIHGATRATDGVALV